MIKINRNIKYTTVQGGRQNWDPLGGCKFRLSTSLI